MINDEDGFGLVFWILIGILKIFLDRFGLFLDLFVKVRFDIFGFCIIISMGLFLLLVFEIDVGCKDMNMCIRIRKFI